MRHQLHLKALCLAVAVAVLVPPSSSAQIPLIGGGSKDGVVLTRNLPPTVDLANKRIALEITAAAGVPVQYLDTLKTRLSTGIQSDRRFTIDAASPATLVKLTATRLAITRSELPMTIKGQPTQVTRVSGDLQISLQVIDAISKNPLDSGNLQATLERNYYQLKRGGILGQAARIVAPSPISDKDAFDLMLADVSGQVIRRIAQTEQSINVGLPTGPLDKYKGKAQSKEWVSLYDDITDMKAPSDDDDKALRQFWLGVAKEGLAYETKDRSHARETLVEAARHYEGAFKLKPDESKYLDGKHRAEESTVLLAGAIPGGAPAAAGQAGTRSVPGGNADEEVMTNDVVIYLLSNKMTPQTVINIIKDTKKTQFDVSFAALGRLSSANVPENVIEAMRSRAKEQ